MRRLLLAILACALAACSSISGTYPRKGPIIPDASIRLTSDYAIGLTDAVMIAGVLYLAYQVVDPLAPAWEIREVHLAEDRIQFDMQMQRISFGGDGEARMVMQRRARALARQGGYTGYEIVSYAENIDSRLFLPRRMAEAEIRLTRPL
ncbi:MAG: hypothetical protein REI94_20890 [Moraxellaceae bacterium]|nr:hypothetical protein [Moraxellaceae bacterium]